MLKQNDTNITHHMSAPKKHTRAQRYLRVTVFSFLVAFILFCSISVYLQFFSPSQRLWRELSAYKSSLDRNHPRPDFVPHLGRNISVTKPTIAAVNGIAYAGGFLLAQLCDLALARRR